MRRQLSTRLLSWHRGDMAFSGEVYLRGEGALTPSPLRKLSGSWVLADRRRALEDSPWILRAISFLGEILPPAARSHERTVEG